MIEQPYSMCPALGDCRPVRLETRIVEVRRRRNGGSIEADFDHAPLFIPKWRRSL